MKKFLSIILAVLLAATMLPAPQTFAAEETVYTYYFDNEAYQGTHAVDSSGNERQYAVLASGVEATGKGNIWKAIYVNSYQKRVHELTKAGVGGISGNARWGREYYKNNTHNGNVGWMFEITVPQKGTYIPTVEFDLASYGAIVSTRVISETERAAKGLNLADGDIDTVLSEIPITDAHKKDTYDENASGLSIDKLAEHELPAVELDEGKNYVVFLVDGACDTVKEKNIAEAATVVFEIRSLSLEKVPAAKVELSCETSSLEVGAESTLVAKVYDSEDVEISDTVTFSSSAPSVASVDSETGVVTANAIGEATITATTSNGLTDTVEVVVEKTTKYYLTTKAFKEEFASSITGLSKDGTADGTNYEYIADGFAKWDSLNAYGAQSLKIFNKRFVFRLKRGATIDPNVNGITYRINVPEAGEYKLNFNYFKNSNGLIAGVWFADEKMLAEKNITMAGTGSSTGCRVVMRNYEPDIEVDTYDTSILAEEADISEGLTPIASGKTYKLVPGEYYVVIGVTGKNEKFDNSKTGDAYGNNETDGAFSYILYESIDLIKVDEYVVPEAPATPATTELYVYSPFEGAVTSEDIEVGHKLNVEVGTKITLSAKETVGDKVFVGWKNGAGALVSTKTEETFDIYTKTALMPIYDNESDSPKVEFWNRSGNLISEVEVEAGTKFGDVEKPSASLNGFGEASGWSVSDDMEINGTVRAVALYDYEDEGIAVKNVSVNGSAVEDATYNKKLELQESGASYWTRNAKTVAFGESFVHYIFNSINGSVLLAHKGAVTIRPVVTLDTNKDGYSMIEYDEAGKTIVEAGIIYGPAGVSLESYVTKASVKNLKSHGQFIACPNPDSSLDQSVARGYIVYLDGSEYKVAYSD